MNFWGLVQGVIEVSLRDFLMVQGCCHGTFFPLFLGRYSIGRFFLFHQCHFDVIRDFSLVKITLLSLGGGILGKTVGAFWEIIHTFGVFCVFSVFGVIFVFCVFCLRGLPWEILGVSSRIYKGSCLGNSRGLI